MHPHNHDDRSYNREGYDRNNGSNGNGSYRSDRDMEGRWADRSQNDDSNMNRGQGGYSSERGGYEGSRDRGGQDWQSRQDGQGNRGGQDWQGQGMSGREQGGSRDQRGYGQHDMSGGYGASDRGHFERGQSFEGRGFQGQMGSHNRGYGQETTFQYGDRGHGHDSQRGPGFGGYNQGGYNEHQGGGQYSSSGYQGGYSDRQGGSGNYQGGNYNDRYQGGGYQGGYNTRQDSSGQQGARMQGKGPKGYTRSDERIREEVCEQLASGHLDASDVEVTVKDGEVTLSGTVSDRRTKRMAEEMLDHLSGIKDIDNKLKVKSEGSTTSHKDKDLKDKDSKDKESATSTAKSSESTKRNASA